MTAWAHLPNAAHIDQVLAHLKAHPEKWTAAWSAAWGVISALVAYDDAAIFLPKPVEHLRMLYRIDPHPMFLLLQPAAIVMSSHEITP